MTTDQHYRRGIVLGLTFAEVFILLVFLLLLLLLPYAEQEDEVRQILSVWQDPAEIPTPIEVETLHDRLNVLERQNAAIESLSDDQRSLLTKVRDLSEQVEQASNRENDLKEHLLQVERENEELLEQRAALQRDLEELKNSHESIKEQLKIALAQSEDDEESLEEKLTKEIVELKKENANLLENLSRLETELGDFEKSHELTLEELSAALELLKTAERDLRLQEKGVDPPCWYSRIETSSGKMREKPFYLLNVAVRDKIMVLHRPPVPDGSASDDGGLPYVVEARRLPLDRIPFGKPLADDAVVRYLKPIRELGKTAKIRTYSCVFYVRVWDQTGKGAKARWQEAHDGVLEGLFGTYKVRDDPWPGR